MKVAALFHPATKRWCVKRWMGFLSAQTSTKESRKGDAKAPQTEGAERRTSGGESLKHETADGVPENSGQI
ncbi:hypothetical protein MRX96_044046 [Rhipicephalus microplus]